MADRRSDDARPLASSTTSTTTTSGPHTTTTTSSSAGPGATVTSHGPNSTTITHPTITTTTQVPQSQPQAPQFQSRAPQTQTQISHPQMPAPTAAPTSVPITRTRTGSIRIRRPSSTRDIPLAQPALAVHPLQSIPQAQPAPLSPRPQPATDNSWLGQGNRRRSSSEPHRPSVAVLEAEHELRHHPTATTPLQPLYENASQTGTNVSAGPPPSRGGSKRRPGMGRMSSAITLRRRDHQLKDHEIDNDMVDMLDVIDPEVSALTTLNNVQNSLFLPNLPWLYNRQPTYDLMQSASESSDEEMGNVPARGASRNDRLTDMTQPGEHEQASRGQLQRTDTLDSTLSTLEEGPGHHFAVLPHGASLPGWTDEEKDALDDHVRHLLHSRRAKFKRSMRGFGRYCRNPLGLIVTIYFFLITFWGAAWVLFLIGWISVAGRQAYFVEICDQILTALFCVVGITMFPFRLYDTYHMSFVAYFAHKTWRLRKERGLKDLEDHNELPTMPPRSTPYDTAEEIEAEVRIEAPVLKDGEQKKLEYHQGKLAKSHTFYRPHETYTHHAFSIRLLITVVVLLDCHSMFQIALGGTTWGIYYKVRPKALTAVILACSLTCNIISGIIIGIGDKRSRKTLVVEQMMRQGLTEEALKKLRKERGLKARGLPTKEKKKQMQKAIGEKKKNPLDTVLHRG
ncbi:hypothetical protein EKO04_002526 [Ascochyta lentis]|uniref:Integral membrane protein n=1 Tax=Ascochyta lentis TaxID=205686 RepID=A0A8H7J8M9_9PLEO|nr:hypothetical protein EKO04_002526 [Ascochyta lentis]